MPLLAMLFSLSAFAPSAFASGGDPVLDACAEAPALVAAWRPNLPPAVAKRLCRPLGLPPKAPADYLGPNCFAAVKLWFEPSFALRFVGGEELGALLRGFHEIDAGSARYGDVLALVRDDLSEPNRPYYTHAAIYLGEGLVWNKLGASKFMDRGNGAAFGEPAWTLSHVSALSYEFDLTSVHYFRKN